MAQLRIIMKVHSSISNYHMILMHLLTLKSEMAAFTLSLSMVSSSILHQTLRVLKILWNSWPSISLTNRLNQQRQTTWRTLIVLAMWCRTLFHPYMNLTGTRYILITNLISSEEKLQLNLLLRSNLHCKGPLRKAWNLLQLVLRGFPHQS